MYRSINQNLSRNKVRRACIILSVLLITICVLLANTSKAEQSAFVENTANVAYVLRGQSHQVPSNTVITSLVPLVDVDNTAVAAQAGTLPNGQAGYTYSFVVANPGSMRDRYELAAAFTDLSSPTDSLWRDTNHNHVFDAGVDTRLDPTEIALEPGASFDILVLAGARGTMGLLATSLNDDPSAVVRRRQVAASIGLAAPSGDDSVKLVKSQSVDTHGEAAPTVGTTITYTLQAHIPAHAGIEDAAVTDVIPAGTTYVAGSVTFDGAPVSDSADGDSTAFDPATRTVSVTLPATDADTPTPVDHTIRFQVRIN